MGTLLLCQCYSALEVSSPLLLDSAKCQNPLLKGLCPSFSSANHPLLHTGTNRHYHQWLGLGSPDFSYKVSQEQAFGAFEVKRAGHNQAQLG